MQTFFGYMIVGLFFCGLILFAALPWFEKEQSVTIPPPEKKKTKTKFRTHNNTKGAFGTCKINKHMHDMKKYPRHKRKQAIEEMMK